MYQLTQDPKIILKIDGSVRLSIPNNPDNRHRQEYQAWLDAGNTPEPAEPIRVVYSIAPNIVTALAGSSTVEIRVTGQPDTTVTIYAYDMVGEPSPEDEYQVDLDSQGVGLQDFIPPEVGRYAIRGKDAPLADQVAIIEAVA